MTEPVQPEFYAPWPLFGKKLSNQWHESRWNSEVLAVLAQAAGFAIDDDHLKHSDLQSWELGELDFHNRFRLVYDDTGTALKIQKNDGTEGLPVWVDAFSIDYETGEVTFSGNGGVSGSFYLQVTETDGSPDFLTQKLTFNSDSFYITSDSDGNPIVNFGGQSGSSTPGISSITVKSSQVPPSFATDTITFNRDDFYLTPDSAGKPIVSLASEDVNTTALTVKTTVPSPTFVTDQIQFNRDNFYITPDSTGKPIINWTGQTSSGGSGDPSVVSGVQSQTFSNSVEWIFNHNLNSRPLLWSIYNTNFEAVLPDKLDISNPNTAYFYFVEPFAGTAIVSSGRTSVDLTGEFYGISVRNNPRTESFKNINLISFDATDFYLQQNAGNRDEVLISLKNNLNKFVIKNRRYYDRGFKHDGNRTI